LDQVISGGRGRVMGGKYNSCAMHYRRNGMVWD
jgi:hypothetical protein